MNQSAAAIATLGGAGRSPFAPGTVASLLALPCAWLLLRFTGQQGLAMATLAVTALGTWASDRYTRDINTPDPSECVIDEVAGQWLACLFAPAAFGPFLLAFALFRLFDIAKPWPVSAMERLSGGAGVMADDLLAGLFAGLIVAVAAAVGIV